MNCSRARPGPECGDCLEHHLMATDIQRLIVKHEVIRGHLWLPNYTPVGWWECDVWHVTSAGYAREYEVKLTRADFIQDREKTKSLHELDCRTNFRWSLGWRVRKHDLLGCRYERGPKGFYFVVPQGLVELDEVPETCGLLEVSLETMRSTGKPFLMLSTKRTAPVLHHIPVARREIIRAKRSCMFRYQDMWKAGR